MASAPNTAEDRKFISLCLRALGEFSRGRAGSGLRLARPQRTVAVGALHDRFDRSATVAVFDEQ